MRQVSVPRGGRVAEGRAIPRSSRNRDGRETIVVLTTDRAFWTARSRRVKSGRPATNGTFTITALPAGEYAIAAVTDLEPEMLSDPSYLEQLRMGAFTFLLTEGEKKKQDFRIR